MKNNLEKILKVELIKKVELQRVSRLSATNISNVAGQKSNPNDITKGKIAKAINTIAGQNKYKVEDIFQDN